jgi:hypothetical protein
VAVILAVALFWIWAFTQSVRQADEPMTGRNPDYLEDRSWAEEAEATCADTMDVIDERSRAAGTQDRVARADAIDESSADLRAMLEALASPLPEPEADRAVVEPWIADWEDLIEDRDAYAEDLRADPDARFLTSEKFNDPLDRVIMTFAEVNEMPSCGPAGDVG